MYAMLMFLPLGRPHISTPKAFAILSLSVSQCRLLCGIWINGMVCVRLPYTYTVYVHETEKSFYPTTHRLVTYTVYDANTCSVPLKPSVSKSHRMKMNFVIDSSVLWQKPLSRVSIFLYCTIAVVFVVCRVSRIFC